MTREWTQMVDAVPQIREALSGLETDISYTVLSRWPRREDGGNLITVTELTNAQTAVSVVDQLGYQIDVWGQDRDTVRKLSPLVNETLCGMGFRREYAGPAEPYQDPSRYFRRTFRYGRKVDKRTMRLID